MRMTRWLKVGICILAQVVLLSTLVIVAQNAIAASCMGMRGLKLDTSVNLRCGPCQMNYTSLSPT